MIHRVEIDNFALVEHAELDLGPGLTVLSGETGAGKSMVIDALDFATGGRGDRTMLRTGAMEASVTILLDETTQEEKDRELVVGRILRDGGRSYAKINGQLVTAGELRERMEPLLAIHSQNDQQTIFRESVHKTLLDAYAGEAVARSLQTWSSMRREMMAIEERLGELFLDPETRARRRDILSFQTNEIQQAGPVAGEEEEILKKIKTLSAIREMAVLLGRALAEISGAEGDSAADRLGRAITDLNAASRYSTRVQELYDRAVQLKSELTELGYDLDRTVGRLEDKPQELEEANSRLQALRRLQEKYGPGLEEVIAYGEKATLELERLDATEEELARLTGDRDQLMEKLFLQSSALLDLRQEAGRRLEQEINHQLADLDMQNARFAVEFEEKALDAKSLPSDPHHIRFTIAPNPGEPSMPLVSIVSGGEASRVLLAVKAVLAGLDQVPTIIFDEIDTGISGSTTTRIAEKLKSIARTAQVICVTHNAQIAASADCQLLIGKRVESGRTRTTVKKIDGRERVSEIARLLSGRPDDEKSRSLARDLIGRDV